MHIGQVGTIKPGFLEYFENSNTLGWTADNSRLADGDVVEIVEIDDELQYVEVLSVPNNGNRNEYAGGMLPMIFFQE
jgi:hypothetical protein